MYSHANRINLLRHWGSSTENTNRWEMLARNLAVPGLIAEKLKIKLANGDLFEGKMPV